MFYRSFFKGESDESVLTLSVTVVTVEDNHQKILVLEGIVKKNPMNVAPMSR